MFISEFYIQKLDITLYAVDNWKSVRFGFMGELRPMTSNYRLFFVLQSHSYVKFFDEMNGNSIVGA